MNDNIKITKTITDITETNNVEKQGEGLKALPVARFQVYWRDLSPYE